MKRYAQEITPGDRTPRDPVIVTIPDKLLALVERAMQKPGDAPVWAAGNFEATARPRIAVHAMGDDPDAQVRVNLRCANCYAEDGTRLSRVTSRLRRVGTGRKSRIERVRTFAWRPQA